MLPSDGLVFIGPLSIDDGSGGIREPKNFLFYFSQSSFFPPLLFLACKNWKHQRIYLFINHFFSSRNWKSFVAEIAQLYLFRDPLYARARVASPCVSVVEHQCVYAMLQRRSGSLVVIRRNSTLARSRKNCARINAVERSPRREPHTYTHKRGVSSCTLVKSYLVSSFYDFD